MSRWSYELREDAVWFSRRGPFERLEQSIAYESIPQHPFMATVARRAPGWAALLFLGLVAVGLLEEATGRREGALAFALLYLVLGIAFTAAFLLSRVRYVGFRCGGPELLLFHDRPSRAAVDAFLAALQAHRAHYLWTRYASLQPGASTADELRKIAWLRGQGVITQGEMETLKARVMGLFPEMEPLPADLLDEDDADGRAWN